MSRDRMPRAAVRAHVDGLLARNPGLTINHLGKLAGVSPTSISEDRFPNMDREVGERILAVTDRHVQMLPVSVPQPKVAAHINRLLAVPGVTMADLMRATGLSKNGILGIRQRRYGTVLWPTARLIFSLTPETVAQLSAYVPREPTVRRCGNLAAAGWPYLVQGELLGGKVSVNDLMLPSRRTSTVVERRIAVLVEDLYDRIGYTLGPHAGGRVARDAQAAGFHPPIHYDEDGNLLSGVARGEVAEPDHDQARSRLCALGYALDGLTPTETGLKLNRSNRWVSDARQAAGLRTTRDGVETGTPSHERIVVALDGIEHTEPTEVFDHPDLDYAARWTQLVEDVRAERREQRSAA